MVIDERPATWSFKNRREETNTSPDPITSKWIIFSNFEIPVALSVICVTHRSYDSSFTLALDSFV